MYLRTSSWAMGKFAEPYLPELTKCLSDEHNEVRLFAFASIRGLTKDGVNTMTTIPAIMELANDPMFYIVIAQALEEMQASQIEELSEKAEEALAKLNAE